MDSKPNWGNYGNFDNYALPFCLSRISMTKIMSEKQEPKELALFLQDFGKR